MVKKEMIAMILAGGQGSRLKQLTKITAKPAVPFGGKYRIIDFSLSNCSNSDIDTVGVLTQYQPLALNSHIGIGAPWDLDRRNGGVSLLPPYQSEDGGNWYKGTADAIFQNTNYIDSFDPEYVLILSGDHIYKMDYSKMLDYHKEKGADVTIAVIKVPDNECSRFGIMNTSEDDSIYEFEEKPEQPKSNLASMGVYIFSWSALRQLLKEDSQDEISSHDFGKNIITKMLNNEQKLFAYHFKGYWRDVGTIESFWSANMDLLSDDNKLDIHDDKWRIYTVNPMLPPQYIGPDAIINNALLNEGCTVLGEVNNCVLFQDVHVGKGSKISNSVILPNTKIGNNVVIDKAIIGSDVIIRRNSYIGNGRDIIVIEKGREIKADLKVVSKL
ncbi:glucose-1-phosphate adenylyltransferase [Clostridium estertheticum]|uniref:Glucose-1-phosphate adenylyltransferase n=4 Tax=Clostridium estertheticum TaxID=238834 RepID=A0A1J0GL44_9CLOT|nr:glucose-1-phosphate adenylyltransferase [Clostridium estertheticum]APC41999.1 glucose-1-phosphate adenylyltransferase [Clostridium estertheticum subsp. estertheticum]MBU3172933.1 glucose-1-phosphate adenylyltransferase [Clostridium estertheticum]MBU3184005.1 glucose-1-phosphate adenylyltransferase [Clostridium estertheticum]MBZ9616095.1 glucose-1-phosphate adenylyltransferase [Clostridium estertheticum subsp. laramiense]MCB2305032.1 glucose-1-phosphate adenylyltransferase [Clostridium ester